MNKFTLLFFLKFLCLSLFSQTKNQKPKDSLILPLQIKRSSVQAVFGNPPAIIEIENKVSGHAITLLLDQEVNESLNPIVKHYKGEDDSFSSISIFKDKLIGIVEVENAYYVIQKTEDDPMTWEKQISQPAFRCSTSDTPSIDFLNAKKNLTSSNFSHTTRSRSNLTYKLDINIDVQYELIADFDNDESKLQEAILTRYNTIKDIFINQLNIDLVLGNLQILKEDAVTGNAHAWYQNHLLDQGINTPLNHLFYKDDKVAGEADIGGICEEGSSSTLSDDLFLDNVIFAHELGHMLGSYHTHNCIWPGGEIDSCWTEGAGCLPFRFVKEDAVGTIMSYCRQPILEFHPLVREFIYGSTSLTSCESFLDNGQSTAGTIKAQLTYLGKPLDVDGQVVVRSSNPLYISNFSSVIQEFPILNGKINAENIPAYFVNFDFFPLGYHAYPSFFTRINTIALPSSPEVEIKVEKEYRLDFEIEADDYSGFIRGTPEQIGYQGVVGYYGSNTANGAFDFDDLSKAQLTWNVGPRKYCAVPSSPHYVYDQFPVVSLKDTLLPTKIIATYKENANLRVLRFSDAHSHGVGGITIKLKGPVEKTLVSNEVGIAVANDLPAGIYSYEIMEDRYKFLPFGDDPTGETIVITNEFNAFPKRFVASTNAIRIPDQPELMEPHDNSFVNKEEEFVFHWIYTIGADRHDLDIAVDSTFNQVIHRATIDDRLNYYWHELSSAGTYYWRVRGTSDAGLSDWSKVWTFTIANDLAIDADGDGFNSDIDCDDTNAGINPGMEEIPNSGFDENCDGTSLIIDEDGDGWNSSIDCDDANASINGAAIEIANNGIDEDCNGEDLINTSIHELGNSKINIFPNPISDYLAVDIEGDFADIQLKIFTMDGRMVLEKKLGKSNSIDLSSHPSGFYLVEITDLMLRKKAIEKIIKYR